MTWPKALLIALDQLCNALQCTRPVTQTSTRYHLAGLPALYGGWQARRLRPQHIMDYLDAQRRSGVSPRTSTHRAKLLRTALQWGVTSGRLAANPLSGLRLPTARPRRMDPPTTVEARRMAKAAAPHVLRVYRHTRFRQRKKAVNAAPGLGLQPEKT